MSAGRAHERRFRSLLDELERLRLNGRATDSQFAQNPLPLVWAMGRALAVLHQRTPEPGVKAQTPDEVANVRAALTTGQPHPAPYQRVSGEAIEQTLASVPSANDRVWTHGAPVVESAVIVDSVVTFETAQCEGFDPPERDLAIVLRSLAETFTSEVVRTFMEAYEASGGELPQPSALDWYGLLAAFR